MRTPALNPALVIAIAGKVLADARRSFPWYDALWLRHYVAATRFIEILRPELLPEFRAALEPLRTSPDFSVRGVRNVLTERQRLDLQAVIDVSTPASVQHERLGFGRDIVRNHPFFLQLQRQLLPLAGELAGEELEPSYTFLSLYRGDGVCRPHLDAPNAKWTLDICLDQARPWPIYFSQVVPWPEYHTPAAEDWSESLVRSADLRFAPVELLANDAVLFSGSSQWHYRKPLDGGHAVLLFMHYIPRGTSEIVQTRNWPELFKFPELALVVGPEGDGFRFPTFNQYSSGASAD